jgi:hypothetical protein
MECLDRVPNLEMKLGNYTVRDTFYVVDLSDTYVVLGVQWMITLGKITTNYQTLEMGFRDQDGKKVVLRGMSTGAPRTVSAKRMERIFRHGEVAYVTKCLITTQKDSEGRQQYHTEIKNYWDDINRSLRQFHQGDHLTGGLITPLSWRRVPNL